MTGHLASVRRAAGVEEPNPMPIVAHRNMAVSVHQTIDWQRAELSVNSLFDPRSRTPAMNQSYFEAFDIDHLLERNFWRRRVHVSAHGVHRIFSKDFEQSWVDQVPGVQDHVDGSKHLFNQATQKCPSFISIGKVGI